LASRNRVLFVVALLGAGCAEDKVIGPNGDVDGGGSIDGSVPIDSSGPSVDAPPGATPCDMNGIWITTQVVFSSALGARQKAVNWYYHEIQQQTDGSFRVVKSLDCGFRVTGTVTVTLSDNTLEALAKHSTGVGRTGTFKPNAANTMCDFSMVRAYSVRGVNVPMFLSNHWKYGDPDKALSTFPPLPNTPAGGMEDWDADNMDGITLDVAGIISGKRYVGQRDWTSYAGAVAQNSIAFGGMGQLSVSWDSQEAVSAQTTQALRTTATPENPGFVFFDKVNGELTVVTAGARPELETCKNVQRLALMKHPNP